MTKDERQEISIQSWIKSKGHSTIEAATGFGKTYVALKLIQRLKAKRKDLTTLIIVPTTTLKEQWEDHLINFGIAENCNVEVINTAIKREYNVDFLCIDEIHRTAASSFQNVFSCVNYKLILGLTATLERLDGRHSIIEKYCPISDNIPLMEAVTNGWVSPYKEYLVLLDVDDLDDYIDINNKFNKAFEFFDYDFTKAMKCIGPTGWQYQIHLRDEICPDGTKEQKSEVLKSIKINSAIFMRNLQERKKFINYHPKKLEIARKIIDNYPDSKIITFSNNIKMAESINRGLVYSGKDTKKKGRATLEQIRNGEVRVLNTIAKANEGLSIDDLSIGIFLGIDSSKTKQVQRIGRIIRVQEGKKAIVFSLVIDDTVETKWYTNNHGNLEYTIINEEGLEQVLRGEDPKPYRKKIKSYMFRF